MTIKTKTHKSNLVIITEKTDSPLISMRMRVATGSINEVDDNRGISHFVEHMVFNGTKNKSKDDISMKIETTGGQINAYTDYDETVYMIDCLDSNFKLGLDTLCDITRQAAFPAEYIEKERNIIFQEYLDYLDNNNSVAYENAMPEFYNSTEFKTSIIGTEETIKSISQQQLIDYYTNNYIPTKMILSVSGDFCEEVLNEIVDNYFPEDHAIKRTENKIIVDSSHTTTYPETKFQNDTVFFNYNLDINNIRDDLVARLVSNHIGSGFSSLLFQTIREEMGLVYGIYSYIYELAGNSSMIVGTSCNHNSTETIVTEVPNVINTSNKITEERLQELKNKLLYTKMKEFDSKSSLATRNLSYYVKFSNFYNFKDIRDIVDSVTIEEFKIVAEKIINQTPTIVASVGKGD